MQCVYYDVIRFPMIVLCERTLEKKKKESHIVIFLDPSIHIWSIYMASTCQAWCATFANMSFPIKLYI